MGIDKNSGKGSTVTKNKNRPPLNNKKRARATKIKGELRLPFVLSAIPHPTQNPAGASLLAKASSRSTLPLIDPSLFASRLASTSDVREFQALLMLCRTTLVTPVLAIFCCKLTLT